MFIFLCLSLLLCATLSSQNPQRRTCATTFSDDERDLAENDFNLRIASLNNSLLSHALGSLDPIRVFWHVVSKDHTPDGGNIPTSQINDQISVLNRDYSAVGFSWTLASVDRTVNQDWFDNVEPNSPQQDAMKRALRKGDSMDLNVYTVGFTNSDVLGYSTFPWQYHNASTQDGVVILYSTLPGGTEAPYNLGRSLTHEAGHWVGLYHPFQGGCTLPNDFVSDTPEEAEPAFGCPEGRRSCPGSDGGQDPIHNFMDYSDDDCMREFTGLQTVRAWRQVVTYRYYPN